MMWLNPIISILLEKHITEYDIKSGNTSIMRAYKESFPCELTDIEINRIDTMIKSARVVEVGRMMRDIKGFSKALETGFNKAVEKFCNLNELDTSSCAEDILSIKRDAVFVVDKAIKETKIDEFCHFVKKNTYRGYLRIKGFEFYIKDDYSIDVKGIDDELIPLHQNGMINFISALYQQAVSCALNRVEMSKWLCEYSRAYINKQFDFDYYRTFNSISRYVLVDGNNSWTQDSIEEEDLPYLDISYNYVNIIVPFIALLL